MSQLTALAPPATTDEGATMTSFVPGSPDAFGRPRILTRLRRTFQQMTYAPADSGEPHIRWP